MIVTVVTLHRGESAEDYVGVVRGQLSPAERQTLAERYNAANFGDEEDDERDEIYFREIELAESPTGLLELWNVSDVNDEAIKKAGPIFEYQLKQTAN